MNIISIGSANAACNDAAFEDLAETLMDCAGTRVGDVTLGNAERRFLSAVLVATLQLIAVAQAEIGDLDLGEITISIETRSEVLQ